MDDFRVFKEFNGKSILKEALKYHFELTGNQIDICSEEYYIYSTAAYMIELLAAAMEDEARQNFIRFAKGNRLDLKGEFYGQRGRRLTNNLAKTTIRCNTSIEVPNDIVIAKGTRFMSGNYIFQTSEDYMIPKGARYTDVIATIDTPGAIELAIGTINDIVDKYEYFESCTNITPVTGGRDAEYDYEYKERLKMIPESFTTAGSRRSYEYWTKQASVLVTDVYIDTPKPNYIDIYTLNKHKLLSEEEKQKVYQFLTEADKKALNDQVSMKDPKINNFTLNIEYWVYENGKNNKTSLELNLKQALEEYVDKYSLGEGINTQDYIEIAKNIDGVKRIKVITPEDVQGDPKTVNVCTQITLTYKGAERK